MGICGSSSAPSNPNEKKIEEGIARKKENDEEVFKLLLLGAGESGKSTLFKQCKHLYGHKLEPDERAKHIPFIVNNIMETLQKLIEAVDEERANDPEFTLQIENTEAVDIVEAYDLMDEDTETNLSDEAMTIEQNSAVHALWNEPAIQHCWTHRNRYQVVDSVHYFMQKLDEICTPQWIPSHEDLLRCRVRTTGIIEEKYIANNRNILMLDVGGQRSERKKWMHCFSAVTGILFVAALSEYDQNLFEDDKTNRIAESLRLFENIVNNAYFDKTTIILFLNKKDLFLEKIERKIPLTIAFPEYTGDNSYDDAYAFIKRKFLDQRLPTTKQSEIVVHATQATDCNIMTKIMGAVIEAVIERRLAELNYCGDH
jgi:GTPase SAR1 family protein